MPSPRRVMPSAAADMVADAYRRTKGPVAFLDESYQAPDPIAAHRQTFYVLRPDFYAPHGYSLKKLAPAAGAAWRTSNATGANMLDWIESARTGEVTSWDKLVAYNEDDVRALRSLRLSVNISQDGDIWEAR
ncbi:ribonuclease H-like domain-containing protein [Rhodococcoides kroppenstedtii]|uniref:ribonuclease H-like domain-containing protein n=1 Tax=Rhodococcoides kroppenstedtii TaxID=293050 RepID=UPI003632B903